MPFIPIARYQVEYNAGTSSEYRAIIHLWDGNSNVLALLYFLEDKPIPASKVTPVYFGYFPAGCYPAVLDLLRNERPVYLATFGETLIVTTLEEPVGEGEAGGAALFKYRL